MKSWEHKKRSIQDLNWHCLWDWERSVTCVEFNINIEPYLDQMKRWNQQPMNGSLQSIKMQSSFKD